MIDFDQIIEDRHRNIWCCSDTPLLIILCVAIYLTVSWAFPAFLYTPVNVLGESMEPTLYEDDRVILFKQGEIGFNDIVIAHAPKLNGGLGKDIIKRVMGLPGETIWFEAKQENGKTRYLIHRQRLVDGTLVDIAVQDEFYVKDMGFRELEVNNRYTLAEDEYFLMGDNRRDSLDSRSVDVGPVKRELIKGKVLFIIRGGKISLVKKLEI